MGSRRGWRTAPWIARLRSVWLFSDCSATELGFIDSLCTASEVTEGKALLRQGDVASQFLVIARGTAVATVDERPIALIEAGSFVGDMALFGRGVQRASVTSATHMELLNFSTQECTALLAASIPSVEDKINEVLAERRVALADHSLESQEAFPLERLGELPALRARAMAGRAPARS